MRDGRNYGAKNRGDRSLPLLILQLLLFVGLRELSQTRAKSGDASTQVRDDSA